MTVSTAQYLQSFYDQTRALGQRAVSSDAAIEFEGYEAMWLSIKGFPWPQLSSGGEIEIPTPLGAAMFQPQQIKVHQEGQVQMLETTAGSVSDMLLRMIANGGTFNAKVYEGTPDKYHRFLSIKDAFLVTENPDRDWDNRSQIVTISGRMFFHYFGDVQPGNI